MKRKLYSTFAVVFALTGVLLFVNASDNTSARSNKFSKLIPHGDRSPANFNKLRAPISTSVVRLDDRSQFNLLRLQGTVKASRDFQNLKISWALPEGVEIVSGSLEQFVTLASGESQSFEILISQKSTENKQVYFQASSDETQEEKIGSTAQYNTTKQDEIAKQLKENFLKAREKVRAGELRKIIF